MPRTRRVWVPGQGAHFISRFVDHRFCLADDHDRAELLESIERADHRWDWRWLSYAWMSSHLHSTHIAGEVEPDRFFRSAHTRFAGRYHGREGREKTLGPVFAERPKIYVLGSGDLPRVVAYHHRNPYEAGVVERPRDSTWTSHRAYLRLDEAPSWLDVEWALSVLGFADTEAGRRRFDEFVMEVDLSDRPWESPREPSAEPSPRSCPDPVDWNRLKSLAATVAGIEREQLSARTRAGTMARRLVALVATRDFGQTYAEVGVQLGMQPGSVFNLTLREGPRSSALESVLAELRRRLAA